MNKGKKRTIKGVRTYGFGTVDKIRRKVCTSYGTSRCARFVDRGKLSLLKNTRFDSANLRRNMEEWTLYIYIFHLYISIYKGEKRDMYTFWKAVYG